MMLLTKVPPANLKLKNLNKDLLMDKQDLVHRRLLLIQIYISLSIRSKSMQNTKEKRRRRKRSKRRIRRRT